MTIEIVGVCAEHTTTRVREEAPPQFFMPYVQQSKVGGMTYAIRTRLAGNR